MTPQAIVATGIAAAAIAALITLLVVRLRDARLDRDAAIAGRGPLERKADALRDELVTARRLAAGAEARLEHTLQRVGELELELAELTASPIVGKVVVVNTPRPDDQSIRGVVTRELEDGGVVLTAAVVLETVVDRAGESSVEERPAGDVVVRRVSWVQELPPEPED